MATITAVAANRAGATLALQDTASGGDEIVFSGGAVLVTFHNDHASAITVTIAPTVATDIGRGGSYTVPTRSQSIAAGAMWSILFDNQNVSPYLNANGRIPVTYTSHNAALKMTAQSIT